MTMKFGYLLASLAFALPLPLLAQHDHMGGATPSEYGQAQFAAMAEIVNILENDPETDWTSVNMDALHAHLLDMDRVMTLAQSVTEVTDQSVIFHVTGEGRAIESIKRMGAAHAAMMANNGDWRFDVRQTDDGMDMEVFADEAGRAQIAALGFFGLLTKGAHHQVHHLAIARGENPHH